MALGNIIIRTPYIPHSIYLRGTISRSTHSQVAAGASGNVQVGRGNILWVPEALGLQPRLYIYIHIYIYIYDRGTFRVYLPPWVLFTIYIYNLDNLNNLINLNPAHLNFLHYLLYKSGQRI